VQVPLTITVNPVLTDASETVAIPAGSGPLTLNLLDNTVPPPGTTVSITSFTLPGSSVVYTPGPTPVAVTDPVTGKVAGTIAVLPDGTATFAPASGFTGPVPAISYTVTSSDGQVSPGALDITVLPGEDGFCLLTDLTCCLLTRVPCLDRAPWPAFRTPHIRPRAARMHAGALLAGLRRLPSACNAAGTPASAVYNDAADTATTPMGTPVSGNVLATANIPAGSTAQVTGFSIAGSTTTYPPGSNVTLNDPATGEPIGTLVLSSSGAYTFDPVPGYVGPTPAINVYSQSSKGVTDVSSLTIDVLPGTLHWPHCNACATWLHASSTLHGKHS
jgi:hypothetical protein